jgi:hypothetical protein
MRDLFRLVAIAALSFAVVGIAMVYSRGGDIATTVRSVSEGVSGVVSDVGDMIAGTPADEADAPLHSLSLMRPNATQWVGLAGFPDQTEIGFALPRGGHFVSGALDLSFDTQLTQHGDGLMTLSVNGTPRGQVVLDSGRATHQVRIALTPADLAGERVVLHMAGRGTTNSGQICPTDAANSGSAVTLTADSRLELISDRPLTDAVGALAVAPQPLAVAPGGSEGDMALAIWASQQLDRSGIATRLGEAGSGETAIEVSDHAVAAAGMSATNLLVGQRAVDRLIDTAGAATPLPAAWPVSVADLGAETIVKTFRGSRRWSIPFAAADLPGGGLPDQFRLRLKTTPLAGDNDWVVRLSLNGNLIETRRLAGRSDTIALDVGLPAERLLPRNALVVELVDTTPNEGICTRAPDAQAQLQPESALVDLRPADGGWAGLIEALAAAPGISLAATDNLTLAQASRAGALLSMVLPRAADMRFDGEGAVHLSVVGRAGLAQHLAGVEDGGVTAILPAGTALAAIPVPGAEFGAALERLGPDDVVILATGL